MERGKWRRRAAGSGRQPGAVGLALLAGGGLLAGCLWGDDPHRETRLTRDFYLSWVFDENERQILFSPDGTGQNGAVVVAHTVFAVGCSAQFIIAKQHPDKQAEVGRRLFGARDDATGAFALADAADTVYLSAEDSVFRRAGRWYHVSNGWSPPDSLKPYLRQTFYYLVDLRPPREGDWAGYRVYKFDDSAQFQAKRRALGVPDTLAFRPAAPGRPD